MSDSEDLLSVSRETFVDQPCLTTMATGPYQESAPRAWRHLWSNVNADLVLRDKVRRVIGYGLDNPAQTAPDKIRYRANVVFADATDLKPLDGIETDTIPGGDYMIHRMQGAYSQMPATFGRLFEEITTVRGLEPDFCRPFLEIYLNSPDDTTPDELLTDLCIPVK